MIVDAHHHLWDLSRRRYAFLEEPGHEPIRRDFGVEDLAATVAPHDVVETVVVQAAPELSETEELLELTALSPLIGAVVGWIDFDAPDADAAGQIGRLRSHRGGARLAAIRAMAQDHPDPGWLGSDGVARGARAVADAGLACELLIRPPHLKAALRLVRRLPEATFVIDHAGKPPIASGEIASWAQTMRALAREPHTVCKVSGLITEADWGGWTPGQIEPYIDVVAQCFGEDRILFGSDWPVCLVAGDYADVLDVARSGLRGLDPDRVFAANARRVYGLGSATPAARR